MKGINFLQTAPSSPFSLAPSSIINPFFRKPYKLFTKTTNFSRPIAAGPNPTPISPSSSSPSSHKPQLPLFLRSPVHHSTLTDLQKFGSWAKSIASKVGSTFVEQDNGPDSTLLLRELRWFLEDSLEEPSLLTHLGMGQSSGVGGGYIEEVRLKASLEEMYGLWKERIEQRRPLQYIVGCEHWRDLILTVEEGVLIPRPETEKIVELAECALRNNEGLRGGWWADLGTGSGALAIGIGRILRGGGRVIATDLSPVAVAVAKFNVERYGLQDTIDVRQGSWFDPLVHLEGKLSGLVSNPPYIPSDNLKGLQAEVAKHEPLLALDGGVEGMDSLVYISQKASIMLKSGGFFTFETNGEKQSEALASYIQTETGSRFHDVNIVSDFAGIPRFVTGFRG